MRIPARSRSLAASLLALLLSAALGCGTILYPERRGQSGGRLDVAVVLLDAVGLLFFFVPGVVAFAVDFATGAIYLPGGRKRQLAGVSGELVIERHPLPERSAAAIEAALRTHGGVEVDLSGAILIDPAVPAADVDAWLASLNSELARTAAAAP